MNSAMYFAKLVDGEWWVGFLYSDGRFDRIRTYGNGKRAHEAAERMNGNPSWKQAAPADS